MDLEGPLSKSTYAIAAVCPFKAYAHKVLKIPAETTDAAKNGTEVHRLWGLVLSGHIGVERAMAVAPNDEVKELIREAILREPIPWEDRQVFELKLCMEGFIGYLDRCGINPTTGEWFVEDLKTGSYEYDDEFERDLYTYLYWRHAGVRAVKFYRFFCRTGTVQEFFYPAEHLETVVKDKLQKALEYIVNTDPIPKPGLHCENWYGAPCRFLGKECPASEFVPVVADKFMPSTANDLGKAFLDVFHGDITPEKASKAYLASQQLKQACERVIDEIKNFTRDNGPIEVGGQLLGWQERKSYDVDKEFVLKTLLDADVPVEDIARVVSISKTSIGRLPKYWGKLKNQLWTLAVTETESEPKFGKIKEKT